MLFEKKKTNFCFRPAKTCNKNKQLGSVRSKQTRGRFLDAMQTERQHSNVRTEEETRDKGKEETKTRKIIEKKHLVAKGGKETTEETIGQDVCVQSSEVHPRTTNLA